ncbi:MAG: hypothetical protein PHU25_14420 [Deltaproteobacteria bacterium]|nr:hypothetical protein [Deltaproteobacteria bacterium]
MARASIPGLLVSPRAMVRRRRVLPIRGEVLVEQGQSVGATDVVARALLPGEIHPVNVASVLGVPCAEVPSCMRVAAGESVRRGRLLAESRSFFGMFRQIVESPVDGILESVSKVTGQIMLRAAPKPLEITAYMPGRVASVIPGFGVEIEAEIAFVQGIFGVGGEQSGTLVRISDRPGEKVDADGILDVHRGAILAGGGRVTREALARLGAVGARGLVTSSMDAADLLELIGATRNLSVTGDEGLGFTLILTEGFGELPMAARTFDLLASLAGHTVSVSGATQIRAGVIRPDVSAAPLDSAPRSRDLSTSVEPGARVRIVRGKAFGALGRVEGIPEAPRITGSGGRSLVLEIRLDDGGLVEAPRSNVELIHADGGVG